MLIDRQQHYKPTWAEWSALYAIANRQPAARPAARRLVTLGLLLHVRPGTYALAPGVLAQIAELAPRNRWNPSLAGNTLTEVVLPTDAPTIRV